MAFKRIVDWKQLSSSEMSEFEEALIKNKFAIEDAASIISFALIEYGFENLDPKLVKIIKFSQILIKFLLNKHISSCNGQNHLWMNNIKSDNKIYDWYFNDNSFMNEMSEGKIIQPLLLLDHQNQTYKQDDLPPSLSNYQESQKRIIDDILSSFIVLDKVMKEIKEIKDKLIETEKKLTEKIKELQILVNKLHSDIREKYLLLMEWNARNENKNMDKDKQIIDISEKKSFYEKKINTNAIKDEKLRINEIVKNEKILALESIYSAEEKKLVYSDKSDDISFLTKETSATSVLTDKNKSINFKSDPDRKFLLELINNRLHLLGLHDGNRLSLTKYNKIMKRIVDLRFKTQRHIKVDQLRHILDSESEMHKKLSKKSLVKSENLKNTKRNDKINDKISKNELKSSLINKNLLHNTESVKKLRFSDTNVEINPEPIDLNVTDKANDKAIYKSNEISSLSLSSTPESICVSSPSISIKNESIPKKQEKVHTMKATSNKENNEDNKKSELHLNPLSTTSLTFSTSSASLSSALAQSSKHIALNINQKILFKSADDSNKIDKDIVEIKSKLDNIQIKPKSRVHCLAQLIEKKINQNCKSN